MLYSHRYRHRPRLGGVVMTPAVVDTLTVVQRSPENTVTGYTVFDATGSSTRAVYTALHELTTAGIVDRVVHDPETAGAPVTYRLLADPVEVAAAVTPLRDAHGVAIRRTDGRWWILAAGLWAAVVALIVWGIWSTVTGPPPTGCWADGVNAMQCPIRMSTVEWTVPFALVGFAAMYATFQAAARSAADRFASRRAAQTASATDPSLS